MELVCKLWGKNKALILHNVRERGKQKKGLTQSEVSEQIVLGSSEQTMEIVSRKKNEMVLQSL